MTNELSDRLTACVVALAVSNYWLPHFTVVGEC